MVSTMIRQAATCLSRQTYVSVVFRKNDSPREASSTHSWYPYQHSSKNCLLCGFKILAAYIRIKLRLCDEPVKCWLTKSRSVTITGADRPTRINRPAVESRHFPLEITEGITGCRGKGSKQKI